jgi:hypothetical protein
MASSFENLRIDLRICHLNDVNGEQRGGGLRFC